MKRVLFLCFVSLILSLQPLLAQEKLDLNKATIEDLKRLPGIGEVTAQSIIEHRNKIGGFKSIEQLKEVKGIGDKKLEILKNYLTLGESGFQGDAKIGNYSFSNQSPSTKPLYQYRDEKGIIHFTQFPETVPDKYKKTLKPIK